VGINDTFSLVNNAGFGLAGPIEFQPLEDFRQQMEVNFMGVVAVTKAFIPLLRQGRGRVVNIGSISGINAMPFQSAYCATKWDSATSLIMKEDGGLKQKASGKLG